MTMAARRSLRARLLGGFEVAIDGRPVDRRAFERQSGPRLLKLLLVSEGHRLRREMAAEILWPELDPGRSAANLRKALHFVRRAFDATSESAGSMIEADGTWIGLDPRGALDIDVDRLDRALGLVERTSRDAAERGDSTVMLDAATIACLSDLGGLELLPDDPYEDWATPHRERLRERVLAGLLVAARIARDQRPPVDAMALVRRALQLDPADEAAHRVAIEIELEAGHVHAARRQLLACKRAVREAYGVDPSIELDALLAEASGPHRRQAPGTDPPIIGRLRELESSEPALEAVVARRLGALLVHGPAGIGKSRLLREVTRTAEAAGLRVIELRAAESSPDIAYLTLGAALRSTVDRAMLGDWGEPAASAVRTVAPGIDERPAIAFASESGLAGGLLDALDRLAANGPLAISIDDIQWLDVPTIRLIGAAIVKLRDRPVLIAASHRPGPDQPAAVGRFADDMRRGGAVDLGLGPMGPREIESLLRRELGDEQLEHEALRIIAQQSEGAPLYAVELLHNARDSGLLVLRNGTWSARREPLRPGLPPSVARLVKDRSRRLPEDARRVLTIAAELGDVVAFEELQAATGADPESVLMALDHGIEAHLLHDEGHGYAFAHPLFRAVLRDSAKRSERPEIHARIAAALAGDVDPRDEREVESSIALGLDPLPIAVHARIAVDLGATGSTLRAVGFGLAAGIRQARLFDLEGAAETLDHALRLWRGLAAETRGLFPASFAHERLGWVQRGLGDDAAAAANFRAAATTARDDLERVNAWSAAAWMPYEHAEYELAGRILDEAAATVSDPAARAMLDVERGWIMGRLGDWHAALAVLAPAVAALQGAPPRVLARASDRLGIAVRDTGEAARASTILERALRLAIEAQDTHLEATIRMHLAGGYRGLGQLDRAFEEIDEALRLTRANGDRYIEAVTLWIAAEAEDARGGLAAAIDYRRQELAVLAATGGHPQNEAMAHAHVAHLARRMGDTSTSDVETTAARGVAAASGLDRLASTVERALAATDWFRA